MRQTILFLLLSLSSFSQTKTRAHHPSSAGMLQQLQDGEQLTIEFTSSGCFHYYGYKLTITRTGGHWETNIYASQKGMLNGGHFYYMFDDGYWFLQSTTLDAADLKKFTKFEKYLLEIKEPNPWIFCTTTQHYIVRSNYAAFEATDGDCQWEGFNYLTTSWFGQINAPPDLSDCLF
ncbi:MAG TPA: hypothetical protein VHD83_27835 [Puia sp.]|nr:hypothetical protein [Puia sp.]